MNIYFIIQIKHTTLCEYDKTLDFQSQGEIIVAQCNIIKEFLTI